VEDEGIGAQAGRGLRWGIIGNLITRIGSFAMGLVLARLLAPSAFGVYSIAYAASQFLIHVNDVGIFAATIQWRGKLDRMIPTATVLAFVFSLVVYAVMFVVTPLYTHGAGNGEATGVVRLLTLVVIVDGVTTVRSAVLMRTFRQAVVVKANMVAFLAQAAVAISLASAGAGAYSFAWAQLANDALAGVIILAGARIPVRIGFDREVAGRLLRFGAPLMVSLGIEAILLNADKSIVGDTLGATMLGFYVLAFNMSSWVPGLVGTAVRYVTLPSFSRLAERDADADAEGSGDRAALARGVQRSVPLLFAAVLPVALVMGLLAPAMISFLYGGKWSKAAPVLAFMAFLMVVRMITPVVTDILTSLGANRWTVWLNLTWCVVLLPSLVIGCHVDGVRGAAIAQAASAVLVALPVAALALHRVGVRLAPMGPALLRPVLGALPAAAVVLLLAQATRGIAVVQLVVAGAAGLLVYVLVVVPRAELRSFAGRFIPGRPVQEEKI
jgi:PST family polysaccharide transporter